MISIRSYINVAALWVILAILFVQSLAILILTTQLKRRRINEFVAEVLDNQQTQIKNLNQENCDMVQELMYVLSLMKNQLFVETTTYSLRRED